jgi:hypothetical protein
MVQLKKLYIYINKDSLPLSNCVTLKQFLTHKNNILYLFLINIIVHRRCAGGGESNMEFIFGTEASETRGTLMSRKKPKSSKSASMSSREEARAALSVSNEVKAVCVRVKEDAFLKS